jgi:competence CoiA-like predicted nuclease
MECCGAIAVAKTSPNGVQFFAHISNECATAPETVWHIGAKALVVDGMRRLGATCSEEVFEGGARPWKADVLVQWSGRRIAIEIQRSYQHLRDFKRRQQRYRDADVECVWLLPRKRHQARESHGRGPP